MSDLSFKLSEDKKEYSVSFCDRNATEVKIPSKYNGKPVTQIDSLAFYNCTSLTSVTIPDSVTSMGDSAFADCTSLTSVTIGNGVTSIGWSAFYDCKSLTSVTIPDNVMSIGNYAFSRCTSLTSVTIGNGVTSIGNYAFSGCTSLTSVTIPNSVTNIGKGAFADCTSLMSITVGKNNASYKSIDGSLYTKDGKTLVRYAMGKKDTSFVVPDGVTTIDAYAFFGCVSLAVITISESVININPNAFSRSNSVMKIIVNKNNFKFESINGNLYTKGGETLVQYAEGKPDIFFVIPDSVKCIGYSAFFGNESLTEIIIYPGAERIDSCAFSSCCSLKSLTIPDTVKIIGDYVFFDCSSLEAVRIGKGVTDIGDDVFQDCDSLKEIYYNGTKEQWDAIRKGSNWKFGAYKISCLDGILTNNINN